MSELRRRLSIALAAAVVLSLAGATCLVIGEGPARYVGACLLCFAVPLCPLISWRVFRRPQPAGVSEIGPASPMGQGLHLAFWSGTTAGSALMVAAAATLRFEQEASFWVMGAAGVVTGLGMVAVSLWSAAHPFPAIRADATGVHAGDGSAIPWRDIGGVAYRRSPVSFSHIEISLWSGEVLTPKTPLTMGLEDLADFFEVVGRHIPATAPGAAAVMA